LVAGTSGLAYAGFAVFAYLGAAIWVSSFLALGYFMGEKWESALHVVHHYLVAICLSLAVMGTLFWWWRFRRRKQNL
jgi:membrane protein DedA with SNARE-associated domain